MIFESFNHFLILNLFNKFWVCVWVPQCSQSLLKRWWKVLFPRNILTYKKHLMVLWQSVGEQPWTRCATKWLCRIKLQCSKWFVQSSFLRSFFLSIFPSFLFFIPSFLPSFSFLSFLSTPLSSFFRSILPFLLLFRPSLCLFILPSILPFVHYSVFVYIYLFILPSTRLFILSFTHIPMYVSTYLPISPSLSLSPSIQSFI